MQNYSKEIKLTTQGTPGPIYEIRVEGELGEMWAGWFEGLSIHEETSREGDRPVTVLYGPVSDQPALFGVLNKIRDLNLTLISVKRSESK